MHYEFNRIIQKMKLGTERTTEIISNLNDYSRIGTSQLSYSNINDEIDKALLLLENKYKHKIKIEKEYDVFEPVKCYPGLLNQVFLNIIKNGIDSIHDEGVITIKTNHIKSTDNEKPSFVQINIKDNGKGISKEKLEQLFDAFYTSKDHGQGTGLGLFISKNIIDKHKGTIEVKSKPDKGTEFIIQIPAID